MDIWTVVVRTLPWVRSSERSIALCFRPRFFAFIALDIVE